jgi:hypothetical protein
MEFELIYLGLKPEIRKSNLKIKVFVDVIFYPFSCLSSFSLALGLG